MKRHNVFTILGLVLLIISAGIAYGIYPGGAVTAPDVVVFFVLIITGVGIGILITSFALEPKEKT